MPILPSFQPRCDCVLLRDRVRVLSLDLHNSRVDFDCTVTQLRDDLTTADAVEAKLRAKNGEMVRVLTTLARVLERRSREVATYAAEVAELKEVQVWDVVFCRVLYT